MNKYFLLSLLLLLTACSSSSPSKKVYLLPDSQIQLADSSVFVEVLLPDYLNSNSIVYRSSATQMTQTRANLWAEQLQGLLEDRFNGSVYKVNQQQLQINFEKFNGAYTGNAEIKGNWALLDKAGEAVKQGLFNLQVPLQEQGYDALVEALGKGTDQLIELINGELE